MWLREDCTWKWDKAVIAPLGIEQWASSVLSPYNWFDEEGVCVECCQSRVKVWGQDDKLWCGTCWHAFLTEPKKIMGMGPMIGDHRSSEDPGPYVYGPYAGKAPEVPMITTSTTWSLAEVLPVEQMPGVGNSPRLVRDLQWKKACARSGNGGSSASSAKRDDWMTQD